jgi:hypothetical protein
LSSDFNFACGYPRASYPPRFADCPASYRASCTACYMVSLWHGGALDFSLFSESVRQGPDATEFYLHDDFQQFLASGLVPLVIVRVMAFRLWLRVSEKALG